MPVDPNQTNDTVPLDESIDASLLLPPDAQEKFASLPPFIQDAVRRGGKLQLLIDERVLGQLHEAADARIWDMAATVFVSIAPKFPFEVTLESLLFFFAIAEHKEQAELMQALLTLYAEHVEQMKRAEENAPGLDDPKNRN